MRYQRYYQHTVSKDILPEEDWKEIAEKEGWDYQKALDFDFLVPAYTQATSDFGLDLFFAY